MRIISLRRASALALGALVGSSLAVLSGAPASSRGSERHPWQRRIHHQHAAAQRRRVDGLPGFRPDFFGASYGQVFVNNNGNITFDGPLRRSRRRARSHGQQRSSRRSSPTWTPDPGVRLDELRRHGHGRRFRLAFGVNYQRQLLPVRRTTSGTRSSSCSSTAPTPAAPADFDIEFNYDQIQWETGGASGGTSGLGGTSARVGYSAGTGEALEDSPALV